MRAPGELRLRLDQTSAVTALVYGADQPRVPASLILAHGAGAGQRSAFMTSVGGALATCGVDPVAPPATLHVVAGGDHSFKVPKIEAGAQAAIDRDVQRTIVEWIQDIID